MRIGLTGGGSSTDAVIEQAVQAENDGFSTMWYPGYIGVGDPLIAVAMAGRATSHIELGSAIFQTYPCHPILMGARAKAAAEAIGRGYTLGVGTGAAEAVEGAYGIPYDRPGQYTEEYVTILAALLAGGVVKIEGDLIKANTMGPTSGGVQPVSLLVGGFGPRMLRVAREKANGVIVSMANAKAIESYVVPQLNADSRIVAGLPVAVHDDLDEARAQAAKTYAISQRMVNNRRVYEASGAEGPADLALVGDEDSVAKKIRQVFDAGATDLWAMVLPVGSDREKSIGRTRALLQALVNET